MNAIMDAAVLTRMAAGDLNEWILLPTRSPQIVERRFIAMYLIRHELGLSLPVISKLFGFKDHTPVINGLKQVERHANLHHRAVQLQAQWEKMNAGH